MRELGAKQNHVPGYQVRSSRGLLDASDNQLDESPDLGLQVLVALIVHRWTVVPGRYEPIPDF